MEALKQAAKEDEDVNKAFREVQKQLALHYGHVQLQVAAPGAIPEVIDLLGHNLSQDQLDALRRRVHG